MDYKTKLLLRGYEEYFSELSIEYYEKATDLNYSETERARYLGRSQAYDISAMFIKRLIGEE